MDTTDAFYDGEVAYFNENLPNLIPVSKAFSEAIVNGPFAPILSGVRRALYQAA
ncbi:hypothetical protein [Hominenteromicrobium sp.]|uniref:hypothetical protein n=1 Tax=Hominenteromicrobium sp. TaxID=3073581 RepID=UPI003991CFA6